MGRRCAPTSVGVWSELRRHDTSALSRKFVHEDGLVGCAAKMRRGKLRPGPELRSRRNVFPLDLPRPRSYDRHLGALRSAPPGARARVRVEEAVAYGIEYSPAVEHHLRALTARQQAIVLDTVESRLSHQPTVETRNRKPMRPNPLAPWELRIGNLRVYYDVEEQPQPMVLIRAVGLKQRNRVRIGSEVIEL